MDLIDPHPLPHFPGIYNIGGGRRGRRGWILILKERNMTGRAVPFPLVVSLFDFLEGTDEETRTSSSGEPFNRPPLREGESLAARLAGVALIHLAVIDSNYLKTFN